ARPRSLMANMKDRRPAVSERLQQFGDPRNGFRIVSPLAGGLPFIKRTLHVDDNQGGPGRRIPAHDAYFPAAACLSEATTTGRGPKCRLSLTSGQRTEAEQRRSLTTPLAVVRTARLRTRSAPPP